MKQSLDASHRRSTSSEQPYQVKMKNLTATIIRCRCRPPLSSDASIAVPNFP
ncbi:hypothetical protein Csa_022446, partial [Cucumis sativus]